MNTKSSTTINGFRVCLCGCQENVAGKAVYRPGHDARHVSITFKFLYEVALEANDVNNQKESQASVLALFEQLGSVKLMQKLGRMVDNDKQGLYNAFGDAGVYVPYSDNPSLGNAEQIYNDLFEVVQVLPAVEEPETIKIGRWTYPLRRDNVGVWRNAKTDGSGDWVPVF
jgi:hypothetical protein